MADQVTCPQLADVLNENECVENRAGVGVTIYLGLKSELAAPLTATENMYSTPAFQTGKGLYKVECKDDTNQIQGSSLGYRKGLDNLRLTTLPRRWCCVRRRSWLPCPF